MTCPHCQKKTIRFDQWKHAVNAFDWQCPHCSAVLRANWVVYTTFWSAIILSILACVIVAIWRGMEDKAIVVIWILVSWSIAALMAAVSWFLGGYRVRFIPEPDEDDFPSANGEDPSHEP